jgi:hypothetical protein
MTIQAPPGAAPLPAAGDGLFGGARQPAARLARPVCCVVVDAEEDFDWTNPVRATDYSTDCMHRIADLQEIVSAYGAPPTYMLTYPVLEDRQAVGILRRHYASGGCGLGLQLHPWVTPPFDEEAHPRASYLINLDARTEESKLVAMEEKFRACFGFAPTMFRAGRYGLSGTTTRLLERHGFTIDTSLAPRTDFRTDSGPDFSDYECEPFWFGETQRILEVPLCRSLVGWSGRLAPWLYGASASSLPATWHAKALLSRLRCAERITLSPEGNDAAAMLRLLRHRLDLGQSVFSLSFHSSSLAPGRNPYVRSRADLHRFYDTISEVMDAMASRLGFGFAALADIPALLKGGAA